MIATKNSNPLGLGQPTAKQVGLLWIWRQRMRQLLVSSGFVASGPAFLLKKIDTNGACVQRAGHWPA